MSDATGSRNIRVPIQTMDSPLAPGSSSPSSSTEANCQTRSLTASITDYPMYWGRRYHRYKEGAYLFPNDEAENNRLDVQHNILNELHGRLYFAPLDPDNTRIVLDLGTGTGIWAMELADSEMLPKASIFGTDLSAVQPLDVPDNVHFEIQDCSEEDWVRPLRSVDYCHIRFLAGSLTSYEDLIRNSKRYIRPGTGWIECQELHPAPVSDDNSIPDDWPGKVWDDNLDYACTQAIYPPRPVRIGPEIKTWMERAGFVDIHEHVSKIPIGPWPKDKRLKRIGQWWLQNWMSGIQGFSLKLFSSEGLKWSREEIEVMLAEVRKAFAMKEVHTYHKYYVVYGRRPSAREEEEMYHSQQRSSHG